MKSFLNRIIAFALTCALIVGTRAAFAAPANPKHVATDAKLFVHLDVEAAKQTEIYGQVLDAVKAQFPLEDVLAQLKAGIGVNPLTDITGITVYTTSLKKDSNDAVLIFYARIDAGVLNNHLANQPEYKETVYGKHTLITWTDENDGKHKSGCFYGDGIVLLSDKLEALQPAVDVLDGSKSGDSALVKTPEKGAFLYAAADLSQADDPNVSQLLSNSQAATACAAEVDGNFVLTANLTAKSAEQAAQIKQLLDGLKAMGQLGARQVPTASAMIAKVQVLVDGAKVSVSFTHDAKTLLQTLQKIDQENKAKGLNKPGKGDGL